MKVRILAAIIATLSCYLASAIVRLADLTVGDGRIARREAFNADIARWLDEWEHGSSFPSWFAGGEGASIAAHETIQRGNHVESKSLPSKMSAKADREPQQQPPENLTCKEDKIKDKASALHSSEIVSADLTAKGITPDALWAAFDQNAIAAEDVYKGKALTIKGAIHSIQTNDEGSPEVQFEVWFETSSGDHGGFVLCAFNKDARGEVAKLKKRQQVTIGGTYREWDGFNILIKDSKVIG